MNLPVVACVVRVFVVICVVIYVVRVCVFFWPLTFLVHVSPVRLRKGQSTFFVQKIPNWVVLDGPDPKDSVVLVDINWKAIV